MSEELVCFPSTNPLGACSGYVSGEGTSRQGLVVLQEWWGVNKQIREEGQDIAKRGNFQVLVPDLYRGAKAKDREEAGHLMTGLDWTGAVQDIQAAARFLMGRGCAKVGVTGFCMGGALSIVVAAKDAPEISAAAAFYGVPNPRLCECDFADTNIPLQCHFAKRDQAIGFSSPTEYNSFHATMTSLGIANYEFYEYDAGHAFTNPTMENYDEQVTNLALGRMVEFMKKNL